MVFFRIASTRVGAGGLLLSLCALLGAASPPPPAVTSIRVEQAANATQLVVELNRAPEAKGFFLPNPNPRFVLDFAVVRWSHAARAGTGGAGPGAGLVTGFRYAQRDAVSSRLVLDLAVEAKLVDSRRERLGEGVRLTYTLAPLAAPVAAPAPRAAAPAPVEPVFLPMNDQPVGNFAGGPVGQRVVVIDAGHGGHDPGARSASGLLEKNVNLAFAKELKAALERRGGYKVVLTREDDTFLPLADRVKFARDQKADLFISLHSDSNPSPSAKGASVYTLSDQGGARAKALMDRQNWDVDLGAVKPVNARAQDILVDLTQRETTGQSGQFAESVIRRLSGVAPLAQNTHRAAGFFVLLAPDVPAVLIELGFLTHAEDSARLDDPKSRRAMMSAVASAIDEHFATTELFAAKAGGRASFASLGSP